MLLSRCFALMLVVLLPLAARAQGIAVQQPAQSEAEYQRQMQEYQQALVTQDARLRIQAFHIAVKTLDRTSISTAVCYPVRIMFRDKQIKLDNKDAFLQYFDSVFAPRFVATLNKIDWTPEVIGDKGITIGSGQIWFDMNGCVVAFNNNSYVM